jgi:Arc/MetJ-type ribon-helix-helix transcriptional regulator
MSNTWSQPTTWNEVCQRSSGRRKYHGIRRLRMRVRRLTVSRHLRREGLGYGVRARMARTLGVSKATITSDVRAILAIPLEDSCRRRHQGDRWASETGRMGQPPHAKEDKMSQRCTVRLPNTLYEFLQIEADARQCGVSDLIRQGLERLLGVEADNGAKSTKAPEPAPLSTPPPHDCGQTVLAQLLPEVRTRVVETASLLNVSVLHIIRSLLIAQTWTKDQVAPQVPQVALLDAAPASAAPIPRNNPARHRRTSYSPKPSRSWGPGAMEITP